MDGCATGTEVHYRRRLSPHGMLRHRDGDVHFRSGVPPTQVDSTLTDVLRYRNVEVQHYAAEPPVSPPDLPFGEASVAGG